MQNPNADTSSIILMEEGEYYHTTRPAWNSTDFSIQFKIDRFFQQQNSTTRSEHHHSQQHQQQQQQQQLNLE